MFEGHELDMAVEEAARAAQRSVEVLEIQFEDLSKATARLEQALSTTLRDPVLGSAARLTLQSALKVVEIQSQTVLVEAKRLIAERKKTLSSIRICIFGRTGAGKSTLAEALIRGDGSSVSPGRCGFTETCSESAAYGSNLVVVDTPGIEVFGETR